MGTWDKRNRELWHEKTTDRNVYVGTPLSIQVVTSRLHDLELCWIMEMLDGTLAGAPMSAKL